MKYTVQAFGRRVGAIGVFHPIRHEVEASSPEEAVLKTYEVYDHLSKIEVKPICPNCGQWRHCATDDCVNECRKRGFA